MEFYVERNQAGKEVIAVLLTDRVGEISTIVVDQERFEVLSDTPIQAFAGREAHGDKERGRFMKLHKSGLPILLSRVLDKEHLSFIKDTAISPDNLPEYRVRQSEPRQYTCFPGR